VKRTRQNLLPEGASKTFNSSIVNFEKGATTGWHTHKSDQMLVVTAGVGVVADESHEQEITVGDVVHVLQGENHWHGATANSYMSHITITAAE
jgi:quercetin dioxygenase-like cupin family protein